MKITLLSRNPGKFVHIRERISVSDDLNVFSSEKWSEIPKFIKTHDPDLIIIEYQISSTYLSHLLSLIQRSVTMPLIICISSDKTEIFLDSLFSLREQVLSSSVDEKTEDLFHILSHSIGKKPEQNEKKERYPRRSVHMDELLSSDESGMVIIKSDDHTIIRCNKVAGEMIGLYPAVLTGRDITEHIRVDEDSSHILSPYPDQVPLGEGILVTSEHKEIPILINSTLLRILDQDDILLTFRDNHSLLDAERRRKKIEQDFDLIQRISPDGIIVTGPDLRIIRVNTRATLMCGVSSVLDLNGCDLLDLIEPAWQDVFIDDVASCFEHGVERGDFILRSKGGEEIPVEISFACLLCEKGNVAGLLLIIRDLTRQKEALEAYAVSEQRYRKVIEEQTELICRYTPDGTIIFVNDSYCRYFGVQVRDIIGTPFNVRIPEDDAPILWSYLRSLTPEHDSGEIEHRVIMPDGRIRWQQWHDRAIFDGEGFITEYQSVGRDITERKQVEAEYIAIVHDQEKNLRTTHRKITRAIRIIQNLIGNVQKKPPNIELTDIIIDLDNLKEVLEKI